MQGIVGIYTTKSAADAALVGAKTRERDDYHNFVISEEELDKLSTSNFGVLRSTELEGKYHE